MSFCFFFKTTATTEIYTLSLHDALPISTQNRRAGGGDGPDRRAHRNPAQRNRSPRRRRPRQRGPLLDRPRSEEHTSELQSQSNLVCRLLLEKKKNYKIHDVKLSLR